MTSSRPSSVSSSATPPSGRTSFCSRVSASAGTTATVSVEPPWNPMSSRTRSSLPAIAHQLREDAVDGARVEKCHLQAVEAGPRRVVDQLDPLRVEPGQLSLEVVDLIGHVVHARPAPGEELPDRRVLSGRGEQLDPPPPDAHGRRLDALLGHGV